MMRFFADHCVPTAVIALLREHGHEVLRLRDHLPTDSADPIVIRKAQELQAVLISLNGDFADIVRYPPADFGGIVALQLRNRPESVPSIMSRLRAYLSIHPDLEHFRGVLLLVEAHRIRIRR